MCGLPMIVSGGLGQSDGGRIELGEPTLDGRRASPRS